jgi:hypothetical protein
MSAITAADIDAALKELYDGQKCEEMVFGKDSRPFLNRVKTNTDFQGDLYPLPVMYEDTHGGSCTFSTAQSNVGAPELEQFQIDVKEYYRVVQIKTKALRKAKSDLGSFLSKQKIRVDSALNALANDLEVSLFRTESGKLGTISSEDGGYVITLTAAADAKNFQKGMKIVAAADESSAPDDTVMTITDIDRSAGTITVDQDIGDSGWAATNVLFREGDYVSASDVNRISGLEDWIPSSAPGATAFKNVDRSSNPNLLGGQRQTGDLNAIQDSLIDAMVKGNDEMLFKPDVGFCDHTLWGLLSKEMGVEIRREGGGDGKGGFQSLFIAGHRGILEIIPCTFCQSNIVWLLDMSTWTLFSAGPTAGVFDDDGNTILRISDEDGLEIRCVSYPELGCNAPGKNMRVDFS